MLLKPGIITVSHFFFSQNPLLFFFAVQHFLDYFTFFENKIVLRCFCFGFENLFQDFWKQYYFILDVENVLHAFLDESLSGSSSSQLWEVNVRGAKILSSDECSCETHT
jgi:hypothetical protein